MCRDVFQCTFSGYNICVYVDTLVVVSVVLFIGSGRFQKSEKIQIERTGRDKGKVRIP